MRIVDDDSGVGVVDVGLVAAVDGIEGGFSIDGFCGMLDGGRTTVDGGLFNDKCVVFTNGFADADSEGFRVE